MNITTIDQAEKTTSPSVLTGTPVVLLLPDSAELPKLHVTKVVPAGSFLDRLVLAREAIKNEESVVVKVTSEEAELLLRHPTIFELPLHILLPEAGISNSWLHLSTRYPTTRVPDFEELESNRQASQDAKTALLSGSPTVEVPDEAVARHQHATRARRAGQRFQEEGLDLDKARERGLTEDTSDEQE